MSFASQVFKHDPLDTLKQEIRLLRILPTQKSQESEICCLLKHFDLNDVCANGISDEDDDRSWSLADVFGATLEDLHGRFTYQALSYNWGVGKLLDILINGKTFKVRENLYYFLDECRRTPLIYNYIWIDQICIDQGTINERNHQVQHMGRIFKSASQVIVWLGPLNDDLSEIAFQLIKEENLRGSRSGDSPEQSMLVKDSRLLVEAMGALFGRPYWTRLWIVQEALLAKDLVFCLGPACVPVANLIDFCRAQIKWFRDASNSELSILPRKFIVPKEVCELVFGVEYRAPTTNLHATTPPLTPTAGRHSLRKRSYTLEHFSLSQLIANFSGLDCADSRDKVFGLLGLVRPEDRITIDYGMSCTEILRLTRFHVRSNERLQLLGQNMGIPIDDVNNILGLSYRDQDEVALAFGRAPSLHSWSHIPIMEDQYPTHSYLPFRERQLHSSLDVPSTESQSSSVYQCCGEPLDSLHQLLQHLELKHTQSHQLRTSNANLTGLSTSEWFPSETS